MSAELARYGTTVNGFLPGFIDTPMTAAMPQESCDALMTDILLGRAGKPEDIGVRLPLQRRGLLSRRSSDQ